MNRAGVKRKHLKIVDEMFPAKADGSVTRPFVSRVFEDANSGGVKQISTAPDKKVRVVLMFWFVGQSQLEPTTFECVMQCRENASESLQVTSQEETQDTEFLVYTLGTMGFTDVESRRAVLGSSSAGVAQAIEYAISHKPQASSPRESLCSNQVALFEDHGQQQQRQNQDLLSCDDAAAESNNASVGLLLAFRPDGKSPECLFPKHLLSTVIPTS